MSHSSHSSVPTFVPFEPTPRQAEILEQAFGLVRESGLGNLTLKKVAERVGFTEAAIYRHFPNKAALVDALLRVLGSRLLGPIGAIAGDAALAPALRVERMVRHHLSLLQQTRGLPILLVAEALATGDDAVVARMRSIVGTYVGILGGALAELDLPLAAPVERQAILFLGLPASLGLLLRAWPELSLGDDEIEELVAYYVRALTRPGRGEPETST